MPTLKTRDNILIKFFFFKLLNNKIDCHSILEKLNNTIDITNTRNNDSFIINKATFRS